MDGNSKKKKTKNIYYEHLTIDNLYKMWDIVKKTCKNKKEVYKFSLNLSTNINYIYNSLYDKTYKPSKYKIFMIFEPKPRLVASQTITDKIVNHFITNYYLIPYLESSLIEQNVATRKGKGTSYANKLLIKYLNKLIINNKDKLIYCLKLDISKYFYSIDHNILLEKLKRKIKDQSVINLIKLLISETNKEYVNKKVSFYNKKYNIDIPEYKNNKGLSIGAMTSQFLAIFYLNDIDHFIKEELKCKYFIKYMDDYLILDTNKENLKTIWEKIEVKLNENKLLLNKKSNIYRLDKGINFLGYKYKVVNNKLKVNYNKKTYYKIKRKLKYLYFKDKTKFFKSYASYYGYFICDKKEKRSFKMKSIDLYNLYKEKYSNSLIIIKEGIFYKTFYDDAKIIWYLFEYKYIKDIVSFGSASYDKVIDRLKKLDISFIVIEKNNILLEKVFNNENFNLYLKLATSSYEKYQRKQILINKFMKLLENEEDYYQEVNEFLDKYLSFKQ